MDILIPVALTREVAPDEASGREKDKIAKLTAADPGLYLVFQIVYCEQGRKCLAPTRNRYIIH